VISSHHHFNHSSSISTAHHLSHIIISLLQMASFVDDKEVCIICCKKVIERGVECEAFCKRWFHPDCAKLSAQEYKKIADGTVKQWNCGRMDCEAPQSASQANTLDIILRKLDSLATKDDLKAISNEIVDFKTRGSHYLSDCK
jgi:hypothetical protein